MMVTVILEVNKMIVKGMMTAEVNKRSIHLKLNCLIPRSLLHLQFPSISITIKKI